MIPGLHKLEVDDLQNGYLKLIDYVLKNGSVAHPRGKKTVEITGLQLKFNDSSKCIPVGVGRKLNLAIGSAESLQLIGGVSDAAQMSSISKNFDQFTVDGKFPGAYGPRIYSQLPRVIETLHDDPDSRQAGVVIWRHWELARFSPDIPCTVSISFLIRNGKLEMFVNMRSNDAVWGLSYDAWMFSNLQHAIAYSLGIPVGPYYHSATSFHIYVDRDDKLIAGFHPFDSNTEIPPMFSGNISRRPESKKDALTRWLRLAYWARRSLHISCKIDCSRGKIYTEAMKWYYDALQKFPSTGILCTECRYILPRAHEYFSWPKENVSKSICKICKRALKRGLSYEQFEELEVFSRGRCSICGEKRKLVIDRDHETGLPRGLLCRPCNVALGVIGDCNVKRAAEYLENPPCQS